MKRFTMTFLLVAGLMLAGCGGEWLQHDTAYKSWDHMKFSYFGYQNPTAEDAKMSNDQGWWGKTIPYIPAE